MKKIIDNLGRLADGIHDWEIKIWIGSRVGDKMQNRILLITFQIRMAEEKSQFEGWKIKLANGEIAN